MGVKEAPRGTVLTEIILPVAAVCDCVHAGVICRTEEAAVFLVRLHLRHMLHPGT